MATDVAELVRAAVEATGEVREAAIDALYLAVKHSDLDASIDLRPVERALPQLADYLVDDNPFTSGCAISIFRRVEIGAEAVERLTELCRLRQAPLVIHALGRADAELWTSDVVPMLTAALAHPGTVGAAAEALFCGRRRIDRSETVYALADVVRRSPAERWQAAATLAYLTESAHGDAALSALEEAFDAAGPADRAELCETLGWATRRGIDLLARGASDPATEVRVASAAALRRESYADQPAALALLEALRADADPEVRAAAGGS